MLERAANITNKLPGGQKRVKGATESLDVPDAQGCR